MLPFIEMDKRKELLTSLVRPQSGIASPVAALLALLLERNRMNYLPLICNALR